ncbi:MAG: DUF4386 family protein [Candidatus Eremiobacteraeota bacterium]|nr:DUF4386 family protein [Candidatus Eremiobacteraeota bacterium]MBC5827145.1 DUF4386 family protein [Candidatus Eremiobacteraeota bacterium]
MSAVVLTPTKATDRIAQASPLLKARVAGMFYMITVVTSLYAYFPARGTHSGHTANLIAGAAYVVVTLLLFDLFKPVSRSLSLLAAFFSLEGIAHADDSVFFFGFYCILLGYLIFRCTFLPRIIGVLMALAGLGLLMNALTALMPRARALLVPRRFRSGRRRNSPSAVARRDGRERPEVERESEPIRAAIAISFLWSSSGLQRGSAP